MPPYPADEHITPQAETLRAALPGWIAATAGLVELAVNAERAGVHAKETEDKVRKTVVEVAEWQEKLADWQLLDASPRLKSELRILKATLDAAMDEANAAAEQLDIRD